MPARPSVHEEGGDRRDRRQVAPVLRRLTGHGQRPQRQHVLAGQTQRLARRGQDGQADGAAQQVADQIPGGVDHVLAVVEDQERCAGGQHIAHGVGQAG